ncbi:hypothetical protein Tco_1453456 [Tanacetum coccineum]
MILQVYSPQSYSPMYVAPHLSQPQISHSSVPPSHQYKSQMNHQTSSVPQNAYPSPQASTQPMTKFPQLDSGLAIPVFTLRDDTISCLNKVIAFMSVVAASRATVQQVQRRKGQSYVGTRNNGNATCSRETMQEGRQGLLNAIIVKIEDLDAYDSNYDDVSTAKVVLMANLSNYGSDVISEANQEKKIESLTAELERYKEHVKTFEQRLNIDLSTHEKMIDSQMDDMIK